jgi:glycosyltransferase involved in cell wall biosynthesis
VLEAALAGCALVLGDIPSLRENWSGAAIFVRARNEQALERAINRLIADPHRRASLSARARARAASLTPGRMAAAYLAAWRDMAAARTECVCA